MYKIILLASIFLVNHSMSYGEIKDDIVINISSNSICPPLAEDNESELEKFLTKSSWSSERAETNTDHLTISQITLLTDSVYNTVCSTFNTIYEEAFEDDNGIGEPLNEISYFKAGDFYFIVITPKTPSDPDLIIFGTSYIHVYDLNQNLIKAYAFSI